MEKSCQCLFITFNYRLTYRLNNFCYKLLKLKVTSDVGTIWKGFVLLRLISPFPCWCKWSDARETEIGVIRIRAGIIEESASNGLSLSKLRKSLEYSPKCTTRAPFDWATKSSEIFLRVPAIRTNTALLQAKYNKTFFLNSKLFHHFSNHSGSC